jgi:ferredoxin
MAKIKYRFKVDRDLCIPAMACILAEPNIYELDESGKAVVKKEVTLETLRELARDGDWVVVESEEQIYERVLDSAKVCPVLAIIVEIEQNGEWKRVYPE